MRINAFFQNRLGAKLYNHVWSWGATNPSTSDVFLRVGSWAIDEYDDGNTWAILFHPDWAEEKKGATERSRHIDEMRNGSTGYAVIIEFNDNGKIRSFDDSYLLKLGKPVDEDGFTYAKVVEKISIDDLVTRSRQSISAARDVVEIIRSRSSETERETLVSARMGQGVFRSAVLRFWNYRCAVTGSTTSVAIRASHIKPWKNCDNTERLDPYNGLPLVATLDTLFDGGLISFRDTGKIVISARLSANERRLLSLKSGNTIGRVHAKTKKYLAYHRCNIFTDG